MTRIHFLSIIAAQAGRAIASCAYGTHLAPRAENGQVEVNTFGYAGTIGPTNWVALDPTNNILCSTGTRQSPIDMIDSQFTLIPASDINLQIADITEGTEFENLGTTVEVVAPQGAGTMAVGGTQFALQQFHFHLPSEHLDNGTSRAMEMHMVWESAAGNIAVIGVYVDVADGGAAAAAPAAAEGQANQTATETAAAESTTAAANTTAAATAEATAAATTAATEAEGEAEGEAAAERRWVGRMAPRKSEEKKKKRHLNARASVGEATPSNLLETVFSSIGGVTQPGSVTRTGPLVMSELVSTLNAGQFQAYTGSLTTPPCSEGVTWLVSTQRLQVQTATFGSVRDVIGFNARFPQNLLGQPNVLQTGALAMMQSLAQVQASQVLGSAFGGSRIIVT